MTLKLAKGNTAYPTLWTTYRSEVFRWRKHRFYKILIAAPFLLAVLFTILLFLLTGRSASAVPHLIFPSPYDLGNPESTFAYASQIYLTQFANFFPLVFIIGCIWNIVNEYNWKTIKMIATRQPSRPEIVLGKCLFAVTTVAALYASFILGWLVLSFGLKLISSEPLLATYDLDAIGKGLSYFALWCLGNLIWGLLAIALAFQSKTLVTAVIGYGLWSFTDSILSGAGAALINGGDRTLADAPIWLQGVLQAVKFVHPILLTSNLNRIAQKPGSMTMVASLPAWWSWLVIVVYIVLFTGLAVLIFTLRDVTE